MKEPSKAARDKALELAKRDSPIDWDSAEQALLILARYIDHVSGVVGASCKNIGVMLPLGTPDHIKHNTEAALDALQSLILPDEPDPLELAWKAGRGDCGVFLQELRKHGLKIVEDTGDD